MWDVEIVHKVRTVIGDWDEPHTYSDESLRKAILTMADFVAMETQLSEDYEIDVVEETIDPDPTELSPKDSAFINLIVMRVACFIEATEARVAAGQAITIRDQGSMISLGGSGGVLEGKLRVWERGWCKHYETALVQYQRDRTTTPGAAVLGPYAVYGSMGRSLPVDGIYR